MMVEARELALSMDLRDGVGEELLSPEVFHCGKKVNLPPYYH